MTHTSRTTDVATQARRQPRIQPEDVVVPGPSIVPGPGGPGGYRRLVQGPTELHDVRTELGGRRPSGGLHPIATFAQVSDLHITDAQTPARAEYLIHLADDEARGRGIGATGTYRPQESLTHHVVEAMTAALRRVRCGPVTGTPVTFAVSTGDAADNAQSNEIEASIALLTGGPVLPDSGNLSRWEGVGTASAWDPQYWHPDGGDADHPQSHLGFPVIPGLLDAARRPFAAEGLGMLWYPVHGNHDSLLAGTIPPSPRLGLVARSRRKVTDLAPGHPPMAHLLRAGTTRPPDLFADLASGPWRAVTRDSRRQHPGAKQWLDLHAQRSAAPASSTPWYGFDAGGLRCLVLDTVNHSGGWQGSLDEAQVEWLEAELEQASGHWLDRNGVLRQAQRDTRPVILLSHHPLACLINDWAPDGRRRVLANELELLLARFPALVAWVNGHTHTHTVTPHRREHLLGGGWWEITTASHVDWPQQARIIEVAADLDHAGFVVACTVIDHLGVVRPTVGDLSTFALAGWSRELSANDWQRGDTTVSRGRGRSSDRNVILVSPWSDISARHWDLTASQA